MLCNFGPARISAARLAGRAKSEARFQPRPLTAAARQACTWLSSVNPGNKRSMVSRIVRSKPSKVSLCLA
eukprot:6115375-Karenia_brevis.AAC.1